MQNILALNNPMSAPEAQYRAALASGCQIVSASTPSINGTYATDDTAIANMLAEVMSITADGTFIGGATSETWPVAGGSVILTVAQFTEIRKAVSAWVKGWKQYAAGTAATPPSSPAQIP